MCDQNTDKLLKRAKRKFLNVPVLSHLLKLDSPIKYKYQETLSCSSLILQQDGKIKSRYCKRTWCAICSPIRTAVRIENYKEALSQLKDLQFTTLTMPNVPHWEIKASIQLFRKVFRQFRDTYKKRTELDFKGVYNFEVTYNVDSGLFHPHVHILHEGIEMDLLITPGKKKWKGSSVYNLHNELIRYWLKKMPTANILAQDTRPCTDLIEGFKYQTKSIFKVKINGKNQLFIPVIELDAIYQQLAGLRCFQPFGIKKIGEEKIEELMDKLTAYETGKPEGSYMWKRNDWILEQNIDLETGEVMNQISDNAHKEYVSLTGYVPDDKTEHIFEKAMENEHYKKPDDVKKSEPGADDHIKRVHEPVRHKKSSQRQENLQRVFTELREIFGDALDDIRPLQTGSNNPINNKFYES